ncbi:hypothetical protein ACILG0_12570 [Pseudomonadota bacterium AL_CKDN230030165-1A_HGKHYDSX7]
MYPADKRGRHTKLVNELYADVYGRAVHLDQDVVGQIRDRVELHHAPCKTAGFPALHSAQQMAHGTQIAGRQGPCALACETGAAARASRLRLRVGRILLGRIVV